MDTIRICPQCRQPLPENAAEGLCPPCLAKVALESGPAKTIKLALGEGRADESVGATIGRYKLLEQIGEGGFGIVYVAEQKEPVRRRVALKVIKLGMDTRQVVARFEAERQALAMMDHPNIAKVLDAGATDTGRPFFVMELVRGIAITSYCDQNRLPMRERLDLFIQVCRAIQHAHQKGIIHRDIKPSNILVTLHDGAPVPKVIDFGIAKATQGVLSDKTVYTQFQQFIGTPAYMSPEQAEMSGLDIDTRSDIYSLGVLLYELLVGKTPFDQKALLAAGLDEMRRIIREAAPVRPSTRINTLQADEQTTTANQRQSEPPKLVHLMRGDLDCIVMKCLEKDRTHRYETSHGLAMDIGRFLNNEPITARPPGKLYRLRKLARRNKLAFGTAAAVAVSLILGLGISSVLFIRERKARASEAVMLLREKEAHRQAEAASLEAKEKEDEARATLSASEFMQGSRLLSEGHRNDALAYLTRSFSDKPDNAGALTRLATLMASHSWMVPTVLLKQGPTMSAAQFSPDGKRIVTASQDGTARVWDAQSGQPLTGPLEMGQNASPAQSNPGQVIPAQFSLDGKRIVTVSQDGAARVWDAQTGRPLTAPLRHLLAVKSAQFSPDGGRIVTASYDSARVWDVQSGKPLTEPLPYELLVASAQFSPDGNRIVTASYDKTARVWDAQSGRPLTEPLKHGGPVTSAQFSPDGHRILTASQDNTAQLWDAQTGKLLIEPLKHDGFVRSAQFSPDGKRIVTASSDRTARVWDAQNGQPLTEPMKHGGTAVSVAQFSPDGKRIVTGSQDGAARVWDAQSGQPLTDPLRHGGPVAQFSLEGDRIFTVSLDGTARVWDIAPSSEHHPAWLAPLAEAISGQVLNKQGLLEPTQLNRADVINQIRQELNHTSEDNDWVVWGRWFLADPATRTISPFSKKTIPDRIEGE
jgi:WD40 repeat protein/serine/threonine protein kinase